MLELNIRPLFGENLAQSYVGYVGGLRKRPDLPGAFSKSRAMPASECANRAVAQQFRNIGYSHPRIGKILHGKVHAGAVEERAEAGSFGVERPLQCPDRHAQRSSTALDACAAGWHQELDQLAYVLRDRAVDRAHDRFEQLPSVAGQLVVGFGVGPVKIGDRQDDAVELAAELRPAMKDTAEDRQLCGRGRNMREADHAWRPKITQHAAAKTRKHAQRQIV